MILAVELVNEALAKGKTSPAPEPKAHLICSFKFLN